MSNIYTRQAGAYANELNRGISSLVGIATGLLADRSLTDVEIAFLHEWLENNSAISTAWPGEIIHQRVAAVLADGHVSEEERQHLVETLRQLIGGTLEQLADNTHVTQMLPYETPAITHLDSTFCLTGDFVYAPRVSCEKIILAAGGIIKSSVSKKLHYLVVGGLGSDEWKHGSFGTKIEKAMELKRSGATIAILHEDHWSKSTQG